MPSIVCGGGGGTRVWGEESAHSGPRKPVALHFFKRSDTSSVARTGSLGTARYKPCDSARRVRAKPATVRNLQVGVSARDAPVNVVEPPASLDTDGSGAGIAARQTLHRRGISGGRSSRLCAAGMLLGWRRSITLQWMFKLALSVGYESGTERPPRHTSSNRNARRAASCFVMLISPLRMNGYPAIPNWGARYPFFGEMSRTT